LPTRSRSFSNSAAASDIMQGARRYAARSYPALLMATAVAACSALALPLLSSPCSARFDFQFQTYDIGLGSVMLRGCRLNGGVKNDLAVLHGNYPVRVEAVLDFPASIPGSGSYFAIEGAAEDILPSDLNGDGRNDMAALPSPPSTGTPSDRYGVYVLVNDGSGQLHQESFLPTRGFGGTFGAEGKKLACGDIDGNGSVELLLLNSLHRYYEQMSYEPRRGSVVVFDRTEGVGFSEAGYVMTCGWSHDFAVTDFNGDGCADVLTLSFPSGPGQRLEMFLGGPGPSLTGPVAEVTVPALFVNSLCVLPSSYGDLLVLGAPDRDAGGHPQTGGLIFFSASNNRLEPLRTISYCEGLYLWLVEDLDLDGSPEIICSSWTGGTTRLLIFKNSGRIENWTPQAVQLEDLPTGASGPTSLTTGDFNGDGFPDIVASFHIGNQYEKLLLLTQVPRGAFVPAFATPFASVLIAALFVLALTLIRERRRCTTQNAKKTIRVAHMHKC